MKIKTLSIAIMMTAGLATSVQAQDVVAADQGKFTNLCVAAALGNVPALHNKIKASGYSLKFVTKNVQCNGKSISSFIEQYGKNTHAMLYSLNHKKPHVSITDIAKN